MNPADHHPQIAYSCENGIATLMLDRPDRLDAFTDDLVRQLIVAMRRFDADPEARVGILCGNGRAFSSGADVHQRQLRSREELERLGGPQAWVPTSPT